MELINNAKKVKDDDSFSIYYKKNNNTDLFYSLENSLLKLHNIQNYIPIYENFFSLTENNNNSINLNQYYNICDLKNIENNNNITATIIDENNNKYKKNIFIKFSPLIDPIKYLYGKYDISSNILCLPSFNSNENDCNEKVRDRNNSAYVDGFFSYLSSQCLHNHQFIHGLDFYGSFLSNQEEFICNIYDDIECLEKSSFFLKNKDILYSIDSKFNSMIFDGTRSNKLKLNICDDTIINNDILQFDTLDIDGNIITSTIQLDNTLKDEDDMEFDKTINEYTSSNIEISTDYEKYTDCENSNNENKIEIDELCDEDNSDNDSYSSRSSYTNNSDSSINDNNINENNEIIEDSENENYHNDDDDDDNDVDNDDNNDNDDDDDDDGDDEILHVKIKNFPVEAIMLEKCENTLDYLMMQAEEDLSQEEWTSALMQIIMTLIVYQKMFSFTHNDLHTNNVMFINTDKEYIYYCYNKTYYRVPTFGRIFKIIDFGRSIYKYKGITICSDSFSLNGDAATQYNCDPYFNENKPRLEPNFSFDLCRLACSLFDFFVEDLNDVEKECNEDPLVKLIVEWVTDDKNRNILYKTNGEERYPDFKLYKMIARNVHNHIPQSQLKNPIFMQYETLHKKIKKGSKIINIDKLPSYIL